MSVHHTKKRPSKSFYFISVQGEVTVGDEWIDATDRHTKMKQRREGKKRIYNTIGEEVSD